MEPTAFFDSPTEPLLPDQRPMHLTETEKRELYGLIRRLRNCGMTFIVLDYTPPKELPHATMPEMSLRIWNEFFSKLSREEDGGVLLTP